MEDLLATGLQTKEASEQRVWRETARRQQRQGADHSGAIMLQLVTQTNVSQPLMGEWMVDALRPGLLANELLPFDHVGDYSGASKPGDIRHG